MSKKLVVIGLVSLLLISLGILIFYQPPVMDDTAQPATTSQEPPAESLTAQDGSQYAVYSESSLSNSYQRHIIFFHAAWCPDCRAFKQNLTQSGAIPAGVQILEVDYDTATSLKSKYGVVIQSTFVEVDQDGNLLSKWPGLYKSSSNSFADIEAGLSQG